MFSRKLPASVRQRKRLPVEIRRRPHHAHLRDIPMIIQTPGNSKGPAGTFVGVRRGAWSVGRAAWGVVCLSPPSVATDACSPTRLPLAEVGKLGSLSCTISEEFVLSRDMPETNTKSRLASFWRFSLALAEQDHAGTSGSGRAQAFPAGYCHPPTTELTKSERGPITKIGPSLFSMTPNHAIVSEKSNFPRRRRKPAKRRSTDFLPHGKLCGHQRPFSQSSHHGASTSPSKEAPPC